MRSSPEHKNPQWTKLLLENPRRDAHQGGQHIVQAHWKKIVNMTNQDDNEEFLMIMPCFFLMYLMFFATRPRPSLTAVSWLPKKVIISVNTNQIWIYRQTNKHIDISLPTSSEKWIMCKLWDQRNFRSTLEQKCHFSWSVSVTEMDSQFMICVRI